MKEIAIIIPIFNEEKNINELYNQIIRTLDKQFKFVIIYVNDFSNDNSREVINCIIKKDSRVRLINNEKNEGQSYSLQIGIKESPFQNIVTMDGDGQNDPTDIIKIANKYFSSNYDLIGGIRLKRKDTYIKKISSKLANSIRSFILKDNCMDTGCGLKIMKKTSFLSIKYFDGYHRFFPALFLKHGYKTDFTTVNHRYRKNGKSKYGTLDRFFKGSIDLIKVYNIKNHR